MIWKSTLIVILMLLPGALALAQDEDQFQLPSPPRQEAAPLEIPPLAPHVNSYGFEVPPGWNMAMAIDALGVYDSNPAFQLQPSGDEAQRYSGNVSLTYLAQNTVYQTTYLPSFTYYRQFTTLNSANQNISQTLWHQVDRKTSVTWRLDAAKFPSWGGSSFSNSVFGSLLMQLSGLTALNLVSKVSDATTGFTLEHKPSLRSHLQLDVSGGVTKYVHSDSNQFLSLLTSADSSTWYGQTGLIYDYQLSAHRTLGVGVSASYFLFTAQNYHLMEQSAVLRYQEMLGNHWSYTVSIGPQFREQQLSSAALQPGLSLSAGVAHKTLRSSFRASVMSSYQMGQAQGNLTTWVASTSFERSIGKRVFAGVFATYQRSQALASGPLGLGTTQTVAPALDGGVRLSRHLVWFANYGYGLQQGVLTMQKNISRQQVVTGLSLNVDRLFPL